MVIINEKNVNKEKKKESVIKNILAVFFNDHSSTIK